MAAPWRAEEGEPERSEVCARPAAASPNACKTPNSDNFRLDYPE